MTPETIRKLEEAFLLGCTDLEACFCAGISHETLYEYIRKNPAFSDRKETLKKNPVFKARKKMMDLIDSKDDGTSFKASLDTLNRYDGKPVDRLEVAGKNGGPIESSIAITADMTPKEAAKAFKEQIKDA